MSGTVLVTWIDYDLDDPAVGAVLVNTARGRLVDEHAVVEALTTGRLGAAALDVFGDEPLEADSGLRGLDNGVLTPHTAGISATSNATMTRQATRSVLDVLAGRHPDTVINPEALRAGAPHDAATAS